MYGPQKRPGSGPAKAHVYWAGWPRIGGCYKMQPTGGARAKARSAEPCEPASRGKEQCGAALRGHACDDISRISSAYRFKRR